MARDLNKVAYAKWRDVVSLPNGIENIVLIDNKCGMAFTIAGMALGNVVKLVHKDTYNNDRYDCSSYGPGTGLTAWTFLDLDTYTYPFVDGIESLYISYGRDDNDQGVPFEPEDIGSMVAITKTAEGYDVLLVCPVEDEDYVDPEIEGDDKVLKYWLSPCVWEPEECEASDWGIVDKDNPEAQAPVYPMPEVV